MVTERKKETIMLTPTLTTMPEPATMRKARNSRITTLVASLVIVMFAGLTLQWMNQHNLFGSFGSGATPVAPVTPTASVTDTSGPKLIGKSHPSSYVSWSEDGQQIAIVDAAHEDAVVLYNKDGKQVTQLTGHGGQINHLAWSPDSRTLASGDANGIVQLWSAEGKPLQTLQPVTKHTSGIASLMWSPDGSKLASASGGQVYLWSVQGVLSQTFALNAHSSDGQMAVAWSPDASRLAIIANNELAQLWSAEGTVLATLNTQPNLINDLVWSPDSSMIAGATQNGLTVWDRDGKQISVTASDLGGDVDWSPDGKTIAFTPVTGTKVELYTVNGANISLAKILKADTTKGGQEQSFDFVQFSYDGQFVSALGSAADDTNKNITVMVWDIQGRIAGSYLVPDASERKFIVAWSPKSNTIAGTGVFGVASGLKLWNLAAGRTATEQAK